MMDQDLREDEDQLLVRVQETEVDTVKFKEENDALRKELAQLKAKMETTQARSPKTRLFNDKHAARLDETLKQVDELKKDNASLKEKLSQEMSKNEKLNRKLQGDPSVVRFDKRLSDERVKNDQLGKEKEDLGDELRKVQTKLDKLAEEKSIIEAELEREHTAATMEGKAHLEGQQELSSMLRLKTDELEDKRKELVSSQQHCSQLQADCSKLETEKKELEDKLHETGAKKEELEDKLHETGAEKEELEDKLHETVNELESTTEDLSYSKDMYEDLYEKHSTEIHELHIELDQHKEQNETVTNERNELQTKLFKLNDEHKQLSVHFDQKRQEAEGAHGNVKVTKERLEKAEQDRDNYLQQRDNAWRTLTDKNEKTEQLESEKEQLAKEKEAFKQQARQAKSDFEKERGAREEMVRNERLSQTKIEVLEKDNKDLRDKVNAYATERMQEMSFTSNCPDSLPPFSPTQGMAGRSTNSHTPFYPAQGMTGRPANSQTPFYPAQERPTNNQTPLYPAQGRPTNNQTPLYPAQGMAGRPTNGGHNPVAGVYNFEYPQYHHANPLGQQDSGSRPPQGMTRPCGQPVHVHQHDPNDSYGPAGETFLPPQQPRR